MPYAGCSAWSKPPLGARVPSGHAGSARHRRPARSRQHACEPKRDPGAVQETPAEAAQLATPALQAAMARLTPRVHYWCLGFSAGRQARGVLPGIQVDVLAGKAKALVEAA